MAIPAILQGDDSGAITIALADGHTYDGATLVVVFNGVSREYTNLTAGGSVSLVFTAAETAGMPLGTAPLLMRLVGANGGVETVGNADARIKVTDCVAEVNAGGSFAVTPGGSFAVTPGGNPLEGVAGLGTRYTGDQLRAKINEVIAKLGGTVAALLLCALPCLGDVLEVQTAPLGGIYSDERVVTNVTFDASAVVPGNYAAVSNAAMSAAAQTNDFLRLTGGSMRGWIRFPYFDDYGVAIGPETPGALSFSSSYPDYSGISALLDLSRIPTDDAGNGSSEIAYISDMSFAATAATNYTDTSINALMTANGAASTLAFDFDDGWYFYGQAQWASELWYGTPYHLFFDEGNNRWAVNVDDDMHDLAYVDEVDSAFTAATNYTDSAISTNNAEFCAAVRNVPLAGADQSDLAEIGEYGSYGTVGAAILALIAGLAALKRGKADKTELPYDIVTVTPSNGVVTVGPRTIAIYTAGDSAAAFTVAVGTGETGKARDCELVIDCTATGAVAPTVTWPATFHPRTDAATDFACEAGKRNVYFISEYATGEFAVGGWQETAGGNAS